MRREKKHETRKKGDGWVKVLEGRVCPPGKKSPGP